MVVRSSRVSSWVRSVKMACRASSTGTFVNIIAATESIARQLDSDKAKQLRIGVSEALSRARTPQSNLDKGMHRAIKALQKDTNIVILPADKGNATVVMDRTEYVSKMTLMLEDRTYTQNIHPTEEGSDNQS